MQRFDTRACNEALVTLTRHVTASFRASYGPDGRFRVHMVGAAHARATSISDEIFQCPLHLRNTCASYFYTVLTQVLVAQRKTFGDGTKFVAGLVAHLLTTAMASGAPAADVRNAYGLGLNWTLRALEGGCDESIQAKKIKLGEVERVVGVVETLLLTKKVCVIEMGLNPRRIAKVVVQAFVWSLKENSAGKGKVGLEGSVRVVEMVGEEVSESRVIRGEVVLDVEVPASPFDLRRLRGRKVKVALYDVDLMLGNTGGVRVDAVVGDDEWTAGDVEMQMLGRLCDALIHRGVDVVACQKRVHPHAKAVLLSKDIFVLERLGRDNMRFVQDISNGRIISCCEAPVALDIGAVDSIGISRVMLDKYYVVMRNSQVNFATLVLCAPHTIAMVELRAAVDSAFISLRCLFTDPTLVPGGGAVDVRLAHIVRHRLNAWKTEHPQAVGTFLLAEGFATALEETASALSKSKGLSRSDIIGSMRNGSWRSDFASDNSDTEMVELRAVKASALRAAVQVATTLYNIGGVIVDDR